MRCYSWFGLLNPAQGWGGKSLTFRGAERVLDIQGSAHGSEDIYSGMLKHFKTIVLMISSTGVISNACVCYCLAPDRVCKTRKADFDSSHLLISSGVPSQKAKRVHPFSTRYKGANLQKISLLEQSMHTGDMSDALHINNEVTAFPALEKMQKARGKDYVFFKDPQ